MDGANDSKAIAYLRRSRVDETRTGAVSYEAQETAVRLMAKRWERMSLTPAVRVTIVTTAPKSKA